MKTIEEKVKQAIKILRSEFIATLYPAENMNQIKSVIAEHNAEYKDATHNCYAYVTGKKQENQYYSDQGEPSGTAGKPILNTLLKHDLTNVLAIVTRYYGGKKLGVRGLIDAYSSAVENAIAQAALTDYVPTGIIEVVSEYPVLEHLKHRLHELEATLVIYDYADKVRAAIIYPESRQTEIEELISDLTQKQQLRIIPVEEE